MSTSGSKLNIGRIVVFAGALLAYFIGAGFASGQEVLQFFTSWGHEMFIVAGVAFLMVLWETISCSIAGSKYHFKTNIDVFTFYCGKYLGKAFDIITIIICFASYVYMCAGAGSTLNQQFGLKPLVGAALMGILVIFTVFLGLTKITEVIGRLGTVIIIMVLFIALYSLFTHLGDLAPNLLAIDQDYTQFGLEKTIAPNAFWAGGTYIGLTVIWTVTFCALMASNTTYKREVKVGMIVGSILIAAGLLLCGLAMAANVQDVGASNIPNLILANKIFPWLGSIYAFFIIAGIYTSAVPLLWTACARFGTEGSRNYKMAVIIAGIVGLVIALFVPYRTLVNYILTIGGYVVYVFWVIMVIGDIVAIVRKKDIRASWLPEGSQTAIQKESAEQ